MNRNERRGTARRLVEEYDITMAMAMELVDKGLHNRAIALSTGEPDPKKAFVAAANALLLAAKRPARFKPLEQLLKEL